MGSRAPAKLDNQGRPTILIDERVVMDIRMPGMDGITATGRILESADWPVRVIVVTTFDLDEYVYRALRMGASGFLLKTAPPQLLPIAVRECTPGKPCFRPS